MDDPATSEIKNQFSKKLGKRLLKVEKTLISKEKLELSSDPSKVLCVQGGGLGNDVSQDDLMTLFSTLGPVDCVVMIPQKPYAFVCFSELSSASQAFMKLQGHILREGLADIPSTVLYLFYVLKAPASVAPSTELPPGLHLLENFLSEEEEKLLMETFRMDDRSEGEVSGVMKHRQVSHFGYEFKYGINDVDINEPLPGGIPAVCHAPLQRLLTSGLVTHFPDQLTVNQYLPGQGIPPHVDTTHAFEDGIVSLSLGSQTVMEFRHPRGGHLSVRLPGRSALVMTGDSRYVWSHGVTPRRSDIMAADAGGLTLVHRGTRVSLTFRKVVMDRQKKESLEEQTLPQTDQEARDLERRHVQQVYEDIAPHFSGTRYRAWPRVTEFVCAAPAGGILADVGCGNGKCLGLNPGLFEIGSDFSKNLASICGSRGHQTCVADVTGLPFRSSAFDLVLCIAVIHHMATPERRHKALSEVVRILRVGGRGLVYVWAMEQDMGKTPSKYIHMNRQKRLEGLETSGQTCISGRLQPLSEITCSNTSDTTDNQLTCMKHEIEPNSQQPNVKNNPNNHVTETTETMKNISCDYSGISIRKIDKYNNIPCVTGAEKNDNSDSFDKKCQIDSSDNNDSSRISTDMPVVPKKLHVHVNRTQFQQQDMLVPWQLKTKVNFQTEYQPDTHADNNTAHQVSSPTPSPLTFHRYYHMFRQGELEAVCRRVPGCAVRDSYYDQGNWCVVIEKVS